MAATDDSDRVAHAVSPRGAELVRYEAAGKWFVEHPYGTMIPAEHVKLRSAARRALQWEAEGGTIFEGRPGGSRLRSEISKLRASDPSDL